ncbi:hypothetical protein GFGA_1c0919 [Gluconobacter frateurii NBRC 103465]|nr:hypothetical protein GFGA_1c0919 [Gluconobacter frateurii NBRC 103465]
MSIFHTFKRKLCSCCRQQDEVLLLSASRLQAFGEAPAQRRADHVQVQQPSAAKARTVRAYHQPDSARVTWQLLPEAPQHRPESQPYGSPLRSRYRGFRLPSVSIRQPCVVAPFYSEARKMADRGARVKP